MINFAGLCEPGGLCYSYIVTSPEVDSVVSFDNLNLKKQNKKTLSV